MIEFKQILCPTDFSDTSALALTYAGAIASWYDARLEVLHVAPAFDDVVAERFAGVADTGPASYEARCEDIMAQLRSTIDATGAGKARCRPLAQEGRVHEMIVNRATALSADLIVIGTHGRSGFDRLLLGSTTEKVLRLSPCPVLTIPPAAPTTASTPISFKRILCPIDFSPAALAALKYALELGRQSDGTVTVLHAIEYMDPDEPDEYMDPSIRATRQRLLEQARERLHRQIASEPTTWCEIEPVVAVNRAYREILERAASLQSDLIVMGAQGRRGVGLMFYGSNTQHVVRAATCPVLTVRA